MKDIQYEFDRPLLRTEKGDIVEISVTHFADIAQISWSRKKI